MVYVTKPIRLAIFKYSRFSLPSFFSSSRFVFLLLFRLPRLPLRFRLSSFFFFFSAISFHHLSYFKILYLCRLIFTSFFFFSSSFFLLRFLSIIFLLFLFFFRCDFFPLSFFFSFFFTCLHLGNQI